MEAYSMDLRKRVLTSCDAGHRTKEVAALFEVSPAWVRRLKQRRRERGTIAPLPFHVGPTPKLTPEHRQRLSALVAEQPDATLKELRDRLGVRVDVATICRALQQLQLSFKKSPCTRRSRTVRTCKPSDRSGTSSLRE